MISKGMSVKQAAKAAGKSVSTIVRWIAMGKISVFISPGWQLGDSKPGPKSLRIWTEDWEQFWQAKNSREILADVGVRRKAISKRQPK